MKERNVITSKRWITPVLMILLVALMLTPLAIGFTFSGNGIAPEAILTYTPGRLTWDEDTNVDANGTAMLQLFGESEKVAPGTDVSQTVRLNNHAGGGLGFGSTGTTIRYYVTVYHIKEADDMPGTATLSGEEFVKITDPNYIYLPEGVDSKYVVDAVTGTLDSGRHQDFNLRWDWEFESGNDERDTALGVAAQIDPAEYTVGVYIVVEEESSSGLMSGFYEWIKPLPEDIDEVDGVDMEGIPEYGKPVTAVIMDGETLTEGEDYTVEYADDGTATVTLTPEYLIEKPIGLYEDVTIQYPGHNNVQVNVWIKPAPESVTWVKDDDPEALSDLVIDDENKGEQVIESVALDGELLDEADYEIIVDDEGNYSVSIDAEFLMETPIGEHELTFNYDTDDVDGQFTGDPSRPITLTIEPYVDEYEWEKGDDEGLTIVDDIGGKPVESVSINDKPLDSEDYTITTDEDGVSTIVIDPEALDDFPFGSYVITIDYEDGDSRPANLTITPGISDYQWRKKSPEGLTIVDNNPGKVISGIVLNGETLPSSLFEVSADGQTVLLKPDAMNLEPLGDNDLTIKYTDGTSRDAILEILPYADSYVWKKGTPTGQTIVDDNGAKPIKDVTLDGVLLVANKDYTITTDKNGIDTVLISPKVLEAKDIGDYIVTFDYKDGTQRSMPLKILPREELYIWQQGSEIDLVIDDSDNGPPIAGITIDGKPLSKYDYEIEPGKNGDYIIHIKEDCLENYTVGNHPMTVSYTNGFVRDAVLRIIPMDGPWEHWKDENDDLEIENPEGDKPIEDIYIDGKPVDDDDYHFEVDSDGDITIVLDDDYLDDLNLGDHKVKFVYEDDSIRVGKLTVKERGKVVTPQTGDSGVNSYLLLAAACALCAAVLLFVPYKKRRTMNEN